jgi:hypothetical protein
MDKSMFVNNFYGPVFQPFLSILWAFSNILPFSTEFAYLLTGGVPSEKTEDKGVGEAGSLNRAAGFPTFSPSNLLNLSIQVGCTSGQKSSKG